MDLRDEMFLLSICLVSGCGEQTVKKNIRSLEKVL